MKSRKRLTGVGEITNARPWWVKSRKRMVGNHERRVAPPSRPSGPEATSSSATSSMRRPKGDMASMAHPIFSLSTKPDHRLRRYEDESGKNYVEVGPLRMGSPRSTTATC